MSEHTPGPWVSDIAFVKPRTTLDGDNRRILIVVSQPDEAKRLEAEANFNLAFAAPDLLDALIAVVESGLLMGSTTLHDETLSTVHAAIAKAEGRS